MRLMTILCHRRPAQLECKIPIKPRMSLALKNRVDPKNITEKERGCWYEVTMLLSCLEENDFKAEKCAYQHDVLTKCYAIYTENIERAHKHQAQEIPVPNSKNYTHKQMTYLLRKYPTV